jgi:hypothetical protein
MEDQLVTKVVKVWAHAFLKYTHSEINTSKKIQP